MPHSYLLKADALQGVRRFGKAMQALEKVDELSDQDQFVDASVTTLRSLITLSRGDVERARAMLGSESYEHALPFMRGEYFAARALVLACSGENQEATASAQLAVNVSTAIEPRVLTTFAQSIVALQERHTEAADLVHAGFALVRRSSNFNSLVRAYRVRPRLRTSWHGTRALEPTLGRLWRVRATNRSRRKSA